MLILIRGLPGSGKSTFARNKFIDAINFKLLEADSYFIDADGVYIFDPSRLSDAHNWCKNRTRFNLAQGIHAVVSNTFTQAWEIKDYLKMADEFKVPVEIIEMQTQYENIHKVQPEAIDKMSKRWHNEAALREKLSTFKFDYRVIKS